MSTTSDPSGFDPPLRPIESGATESRPPSSKPRRPRHPCGHPIPELWPVVQRYGVRLSSNPPYVLIGTYRSAALGPMMGVVAAADNELFAYLLRREINRSGEASVERTEYHPAGPTFSLATYTAKMKEASGR